MTDVPSEGRRVRGSSEWSGKLTSIAWVALSVAAGFLGCAPAATAQPNQVDPAKPYVAVASLHWDGHYTLGMETIGTIGYSSAFEIPCSTTGASLQLDAAFDSLAAAVTITDKYSATMAPGEVLMTLDGRRAAPIPITDPNKSARHVLMNLQEGHELQLSCRSHEPNATLMLAAWATLNPQAVPTPSATSTAAVPDNAPSAAELVHEIQLFNADPAITVNVRFPDKIENTWGNEVLVGFLVIAVLIALLLVAAGRLLVATVRGRRAVLEARSATGMAAAHRAMVVARDQVGQRRLVFLAVAVGLLLAVSLQPWWQVTYGDPATDTTGHPNPNVLIASMSTTYQANVWQASTPGSIAVLLSIIAVLIAAVLGRDPSRSSDQLWLRRSVLLAWSAVSLLAWKGWTLHHAASVNPGGFTMAFLDGASVDRFTSGASLEPIKMITRDHLVLGSWGYRQSELASGATLGFLLVLLEACLLTAWTAVLFRRQRSAREPNPDDDPNPAS